MCAALGLTARGEGLPDRDMEAIQMMQQRAAQTRMEEELKNPKTPDLPKDRAFRGNRKAPIIIVEFSDFQCPYCKVGFQTVEEVRKKYGAKVGFLFRNLPLPMHPFAMPAAKRFEAIALQSTKKAYEFHDQVFTNQEQLTAEGEKFLDDVATKLKVNMAKMKKDMDGDKVRERLEADRAEAQKNGFQGTPGFIVAGVTLPGAYPQPVFEQIIDTRLKNRGVASTTKQ
jgi:protein-disulfide isomerase